MHQFKRILPLPIKLFIGTFLVLSILYLSGCRADGSHWLTPYRADVVQGNFISQEQAAVIQPGMSPVQVKAILGTPLLTGLLDDTRWDYAFSIKKRGQVEQKYRVTVFFADGVVSSLDVPQELLTEEAFVEMLDEGRTSKRKKMPKMTATDKELEAAAKSAEAYRARQGAQGGAPEPAGSYPPLSE